MKDLNFRVLFYLKKRKNSGAGQWPVYLRITVDGERCEMATGKNCPENLWDKKTGLGIEGSGETLRLNGFLSLMKAQIEAAYEWLRTSGAEISPSAIRDRCFAKPTEKHMILEVFREHNDRIKALLGREFAPGTLQRYEVSLQHTRSFIQSKYRKDDMDVSLINFSFIDDYDHWLRTVRKCGNNSTVKYMKNFGKIIRICIAHGWITRNPFANYRPKVKQLDRVYLTQDELFKMAKSELHLDRLRQVRDVFLFSCFTGLAYADVKKLRTGDIREGLDGRMWIFAKRQKTGTPSHIPLLPPASAILKLYENHPVCSLKELALPVGSNQKINAFLKEIALICRIDKDITYHTARHTFATTVTLMNGVPMETVSKMLGHSSIKITQHYSKVLDQKISQDMARLAETWVFEKNVAG